MIRVVALVLVLALTGVLVLQWRDWPRAPSPVTVQGSDPGAAAGLDQSAGGLPTTPAPPEAKETYSSVAERPLFRPQRKPEPPRSADAAPEPAAEDVGTLDGLDLTAVLISPGVTSAWIKDPSMPELKRLRLGDEQAGWSVKAILADRLVFERQGETHELLLLDLAAAGDQPAPPGAPVPPRPARPTPPVRPAPPVRPTPAAGPVPSAGPTPPAGPTPLARPSPSARPTPPGRLGPPVPNQPGPLGRDPQRTRPPGGGQLGSPQPPSPR